MSFFRDLSNFRKRTISRYERVVRGSALDLFSLIVQATPVDKGVLRNNWFVSLDAPSSSVTEAPGDEATALLRLRSGVNKAKAENDIYLTNNLPYAIPIEFDGHSAQAPGGVVRQNTAKWSQIVASNVKKVGGA